MSLGGRRRTQACCSCAQCRAGCGRSMACKAHSLDERPLSFGARSWRDVPAAASSPNQRRVSRAAQARRLSLSREGRRSTQACCLRAPYRAGCSRPTSYKRALPRRAACLFLTRARGATCQLRPPTSSQRRVSRAAQARRRSLSLGKSRSTQACCVRVPWRAGCG